MPGAVGFTNRAVSSAHGAACAIGAILARLAAGANATPTAAAGSNPDKRSPTPTPGLRAWAALSRDTLPSALASVAIAIGHPVSLLHVAACGAVGRVGSMGPLPVCSTATGTPGTAVAAGSSGSGGEGARVTATSVQAVFERLWAACRLGETTDASRRTEAAAEALGKCCRGERSVGGGGGKEEEASARVRKTLRVLFDMAKNQVCGVCE